MADVKFIGDRMDEVTAGLEALTKKGEEFFRKNSVACASGMFLVGLGVAILMVQDSNESESVPEGNGSNELN